MFKFLVALVSVRRMLLAQQRNAQTGFTVDTAAILTQAREIFANFGGVLTLVIGLSVGVSMLRRVKNLF